MKKIHKEVGKEEQRGERLMLLVRGVEGEEGSEKQQAR